VATGIGFLDPYKTHKYTF